MTTTNTTKTIDDILCSLTTGYTRKQLLEYSEEDTGLDKYEVLDELKSIDKATQALNQLMLQERITTLQWADKLTNDLALRKNIADRIAELKTQLEKSKP